MFSPPPAPLKKGLELKNLELKAVGYVLHSTKRKMRIKLQADHHGFRYEVTKLLLETSSILKAAFSEPLTGHLTRKKNVKS